MVENFTPRCVSKYFFQVVSESGKSTFSAPKVEQQPRTATICEALQRVQQSLGFVVDALRVSSMLARLIDGDVGSGDIEPGGLQRRGSVACATPTS